MAEQPMVALRPTEDHEPLDRLITADIARLMIALRMYYADMQDMGATNRELEQIARLSRRLADVSVTWVAEEAG